MSLEQIRTVIENFVNDTHNDLLVITGDWGVGPPLRDPSLEIDFQQSIRNGNLNP
ncbi:MAG: hypothetical protein JWM21_1101 [Acidobacteria bacterium]|nr:hypothetical protein [Acidobacteriota bacterium]